MNQVRLVKCLANFLSRAETYAFLKNQSFHLFSKTRRSSYTILTTQRKRKLNYITYDLISRKKSNGNPFIPLEVKVIKKPGDINIGEELSGKISKEHVLKSLNMFYKRQPIRTLAEENGIQAQLFQKVFFSFRNHCVKTENLPTELHLIFSDLLRNSGHVDDLFPYFLEHAKQVYPHLECMEDLQNISDVRFPAKWYPEARAINRKNIFHAGPTNSGKTFHALECFCNAKSGVYCGPLRLLAVEVCTQTNMKGTQCDLITGEERRFANSDLTPSNHVSCTVEMASLSTPYEIAIIDEIQMLRDVSRGWAFTRALLGVAAKEVHMCGEEAAIDVVREILASVGEELEVRRYKRLTPLTIEEEALGSLNNVKPGDCIVCFSRNDVFSVSLNLEKHGIKCALIYGALPPGTKLAQAQQFNDPADPCKILVATDAIGMGLNLSIRRVIFNKLVRPSLNEKGEKEIDFITTSQALQIAGRAGRYGTQFPEGFVTTVNAHDLPLLKNIMNRSVDTVETAGLLPTAEQLEMFSYHLPHAPFSNLIDIFMSLCKLDLSYYFMCNIEDFKFLADMIQHIPLSLKVRHTFCCAPIDNKQTLVCTVFLKFARQCSRNEMVTFNWLSQQLGWPFSPPKNLVDLMHLEVLFDVLDLYLWFSYRFIDIFPDRNVVKDMQQELDAIIEKGVFSIIGLLKASETNHHSAMAVANDEDFQIMKKSVVYKKLVSETLKNIEGISSPVKKTTFADSLLAQGTLTREMLKELKMELLEQKHENVSTLKDVSKHKRKLRKLSKDSK